MHNPIPSGFEDSVEVFLCDVSIRVLLEERPVISIPVPSLRQRDQRLQVAQGGGGIFQQGENMHLILLSQFKCLQVCCDT